MRLRSTIDFLLYDWLQAEDLSRRPRFADHSRNTFDAVMDICERIARETVRDFAHIVAPAEMAVRMLSQGALGRARSAWRWPRRRW